MSHQTEYAVSDRNGYYVEYTDSYKQAKELVSELDSEYQDEELEGRAAIMKLTNEGNYELYL